MYPQRVTSDSRAGSIADEQYYPDAPDDLHHRATDAMHRLVYQLY